MSDEELEYGPESEYRLQPASGVFSRKLAEAWATNDHQREQVEGWAFE